MKFLLCVGAEKAGTTWLHEYFRHHPQYYDSGKELNVIERGDLVPSFFDTSEFKKDLSRYFEHFAQLAGVSGDFTHYEGSTENIFRILRDGFDACCIEVVPVYIMRDPIQRAWSSYNMLSQAGNGPVTLKNSAAGEFLLKNYLSCKYKETVQALDNVFAEPIYAFYETDFNQQLLDRLCDRLDLDRMTGDFSRVINKGRYGEMPDEFKTRYGLTQKNIEAVQFLCERFDDVPWQISDYT